jgi:hypothetical protein
VTQLLEIASLAFGALGVLLGVAGWMLARRWARDCAACHIIIARKGKVVLNAPLTEWLAWNRALPKRDRGRGGTIFMANGVQVALARPKIGAASATVETRKVKNAPAPAPLERAAS